MRIAFLAAGIGLLAALLVPASAQPSQAILTGRVTDASGAPLDRVNVTARARTSSDASPRGGATDSTGRYRVELPEGTYRVVFSAVGYAPQARTVTLDAGTTSTLDVELPPHEYTLNEIVVRSRGPSRQSTASTVQHVSAEAIAVQDAADVSELGELVPATHVQTNSRGQTLLYVRAAGERQVAQFFDGALLNVPWDNRVDVSLIPAGAVDGLTVAKGVPSVRYGANALGGAVNVQTRTLDAAGRRTEVSSQLGTAAHRRGSVTHLTRTERWDYTAAVQYAAHGDQPLPDDADLPFSQPNADRRTNTDRRLASGFARAALRLDDGAELAASVLHVDAEQGVAPESHVDPAQERVRYWRYPVWRKSMAIVSARLSVGGHTSVRGAVWGSRFAQDIDQFGSVAYDALREVQEDRDWTGGLRGIVSRDLSPGTLHLSVNALTTRHDQTITPVDGDAALPDSSNTFRQHLFSLGAEVERPFGDRLEATVGGSLDGSALPGTGPFPSRDAFYAVNATAGLTYDIASRWTLRGAAGRKSRFPTMRELFGGALGKFVPNPDLKPVTAWIGEIGVERTGPRLSGGVTGFLNRVYDTIDQRTFRSGTNAGKEQRINLPGSRVAGVETTLAWRPTDAWTVDGHLSWMQPRGLTDDGTQKLDEKPAWLGSGRVRYVFPFGLSVMGQASYTGGTYARTSQNTFTKLPEAVLVDARVGYSLDAFSGRWDGELFARVDNVTDDARFLQLGLPGPGRTLRAGVTISL